MTRFLKSLIIVGAVVWGLATGVLAQTPTSFAKISFLDPNWVRYFGGRSEFTSTHYWDQVKAGRFDLTVTAGDATALANLTGYAGLRILNAIINQAEARDIYVAPMGQYRNPADFARGESRDWIVGNDPGPPPVACQFDHGLPNETGVDRRDGQGGPYVHYALVSQHASGDLLSKTFDQYDQPEANYYRFEFRMKVNDNSGHVEIARIHITETYVGTTASSPGMMLHDWSASESRETGDSPAPPAAPATTWSLYADDFSAPGVYETIIERRLLSGWQYRTNLRVEWLDVRDLYIDDVTIKDDDYYYLLEYNGGGQYDNSIKSTLEGYYNQNIPVHNHWYNDEPWWFMLKAYGRVGQLGRESTVPLNGAFYHTDHLTDFLDTISPAFLLFDRYTIWGRDHDWGGYTGASDSASTGDRSIQVSWNNLIAGMQAAIEAANRDPSVPTDDVPFFMTLQVGDWWTYSSQWIEHQRDVTANELRAQAYLALCYGAKGLMWFLYPTIFISGYPNPNTPGEWRAHGLVDLRTADSPTAPYTHNLSTGFYVPNSKYYVVQEILQKAELLSPDVLNLT